MSSALRISENKTCQLTLSGTYFMRAGQQVEANKDRNLVRRIQSLQRFLLEQLHRDMLSRSLPAAPSASASQTSAPGASAAAAAPAVEQESSTIVEQLFGMPMRQRTQCLGGDKAMTTRDVRTFQVGCFHALQEQRWMQSLHGSSRQYASQDALHVYAYVACCSPLGRASTQKTAREVA